MSANLAATLRNPLTNSLYGLISRVCTSFKESDCIIESMIIKGDKLFIRYKAGHEEIEANKIQANSRSVATSNLRVLDIGNGNVVEQLNGVFQVKTSLNLG